MIAAHYRFFAKSEEMFTDMKKFAETLVNTAEMERLGIDPDDSTIPAHPNPEVWDRWVFKVDEDNWDYMCEKDKLPNPTFIMETEGDKYFIYMMSDPIYRGVEKKEGKRGDVRNLYGMVERDMAKSYALEPVTEIPWDDLTKFYGTTEIMDDEGELKFGRVLWRADKLMDWQKQQGFWRHTFSHEWAANGGSANSVNQQTQRANGWASAGNRASTAVRQLKGNYRSLMAEALDATLAVEVATRHIKIAEVVGCKPATVRSLLARAAELTDEQRSEALEHAKAKGWDLSPIVAHSSSCAVLEPLEEEVAPVEEVVTPAAVPALVEEVVPVPDDVAPVVPTPVQTPTDVPTTEEEPPVTVEAELPPRKKAICAIVHQMSQTYPADTIAKMLAEDVSRDITPKAVAQILQHYPPFDVYAVSTYASEDPMFSEYLEFFTENIYPTPSALGRGSDVVDKAPASLADLI